LYAGIEEIIPESWLYRKSITIDSTKVSGDLTDFPLLINITDSDLSSKSRSDGYDIIFTSVDGITMLDHEIEKYTSGSGELVAWVRIPSLSSSSDTVIYMYYGNSDQSSSVENPTGVWNVNYSMVHHLEETSKTGGTYNDHLDSTSNDNHGEAEMAEIDMNVPGKIDGANGFDGNDDYVDVAYSSSLNITEVITVEGWFNCKEDHTEEPDQWYGGHQKSNCWLLGWHGWDDAWSFGIYNETGVWSGGTHATDIYITAGEWVHVVGSFDGRYMRIYVNGELEDTQDLGSQKIQYTTDGIGIGVRGAYWNGTLDEVRISNSARSWDWINASYNNQNNSGTFYSVGSEESTFDSKDYEWVELYNAGDTTVDLTGWYLTDNDGWKFDISGAGSIPSGGYLVCHLGVSGTNRSSNVYGSIVNEDQIVIQPNASFGKDNYLDSSTGILNWGTATTMSIYNISSSYKRPIIQFDLSGLPSGEITDAQVWLYRGAGDVSTGATVNVHRVTSIWTEGDGSVSSGANWDTFNGTADWPISDDGGDYDSTSEDTKTVLAGTNAWYYWNVTDMAMGWKSDTYRNFGMIFDADSGSQIQSFNTSDNSDTSTWPKLIVNLTSKAMLENTDDISLVNSDDVIIDYVAWGADPGQDDYNAVAWGQWTNGEYVDSSQFTENQTLGRDKDSTDTNSPSDWENTTTEQGDPYGVNASAPTEGSQNIDFIIPEFSEIAMPIVTMVMIFTIWKRKRNLKGLRKEIRNQNDSNSKENGGTVKNDKNRKNTS
jgi:hypothetical protein